MKKNKAFTLIELIIVIVLFALLMGVILQTYTTISQVTFKLEQEKEVWREYLILSQLLENIAEEATIDYERYGDHLTQESSKWLTNTLYLTGGKRARTSIYSSGECLSMNEFLRNFENKREEFDPLNYHCELILEQKDEKNNSKIISLIPNQAILQSKMMFKVIPFLSNKDILNPTDPNEDSKLNMGQPGFWIFGSLAGKFFEPKKWTNNTLLPLQIFYTLNGPVASIYDVDITDGE